MDTIGTQRFVPFSECPKLWGFRYISGRRGTRAHNRAVEDNVAAFSLLYAGREGYAEASTTSNSTIMVCQVVNYSSDGGKSC